MDKSKIKSMNNRFIKFVESFTKEQRDALWQYFIDHSKLQKNGYWGILFYIRDENDFWLRVHSRFTGEFSRYNKLEKARIQESIAYNIQKKMAHRNDRVCREIDGGSNYYRKFLLFLYRKTRDILF